MNSKSSSYSNTLHNLMIIRHLPPLLNFADKYTFEFYSRAINYMAWHICVSSFRNKTEGFNIQHINDEFLQQQKLGRLINNERSNLTLMNKLGFGHIRFLRITIRKEWQDKFVFFTYTIIYGSHGIQSSCYYIYFLPIQIGEVSKKQNNKIFNSQDSRSLFFYIF